MAVLGKLTIRTASLDDLPELDTHPPITNLRPCDHANTITNDNITVLVATTTNGICGHTNVRWTGFRLEPFATSHPNTAVMNSLGVWPDSLRSKGVGSELVSEVEQLARQRNKARVGLGFYVENTEVQRFYERHGYTSITPEPVLDYDDVKHWLTIMVKDLR